MTSIVYLYICVKYYEFVANLLTFNVSLQACSYARQVKQMLSQPTTTVQQPFCSKQIVKIDNGLSSVAIKPLNPTDKNSLVNVIFQVINMYLLNYYIIYVCTQSYGFTEGFGKLINLVHIWFITEYPIKVTTY